MRIAPRRDRDIRFRLGLPRVSTRGCGLPDLMQPLSKRSHSAATRGELRANVLGDEDVSNIINGRQGLGALPLHGDVLAAGDAAGEHARLLTRLFNGQDTPRSKRQPALLAVDAQLEAK